jgi:hypothetical protein
MLVNLLAVQKLSHEKLFVGVSDACTLDILQTLNWKIDRWTAPREKKFPEYSFPIFRWMDERVRSLSLSAWLKLAIKNIAGTLLNWGDCLKIFRASNVDVFIQAYHPTRGIIERLKQDGKVNIILERFTRTSGLTRIRQLPIGGSSARYRRLAQERMDRFQSEKAAHWEIEGVDISAMLYRVIVDRVAHYLPEYLKTLDMILGYFSNRQLKLMVPVTETWMTNCLMMNYCHAKGIPTYLIINGLLGEAFLDEAKHATVINAYGESLRDHYFRELSNIVCLGDPRMDFYVNHPKPQSDWEDCPTIVIGAAGFDNVDLNSYVAYEFDFLYDVLAACKAIMAQGRSMRLILKVRSNGYLNQYTAFLREYFPDLPVTVYDQIPFQQILDAADFYISIYSQTLFEVSCWGIPALYYRKDTQIKYPPFDGQSELVTAFSVDDLIGKIDLFYRRAPIYNAFQTKAVMEKYIGPLDGHNLERNVEFIYSLVFDGRSSGK